MNIFLLDLAVIHLTQSVRSRLWWLLPTVCLAGFGEALGWGCRTLSHYKPLDDNAYLIQYVTVLRSGDSFASNERSTGSWC